MPVALCARLAGAEIAAERVLVDDDVDVAVGMAVDVSVELAGVGRAVDESEALPIVAPARPTRPQSANRKNARERGLRISDCEAACGRGRGARPGRVDVECQRP